MTSPATSDPWDSQIPFLSDASNLLKLLYSTPRYRVDLKHNAFDDYIASVVCVKKVFIYIANTAFNEHGSSTQCESETSSGL